METHFRHGTESQGMVKIIKILFLSRSVDIFTALNRNLPISCQDITLILSDRAVFSKVTPALWWNKLILSHCSLADADTQSHLFFSSLSISITNSKCRSQLVLILSSLLFKGLTFKGNYLHEMELKKNLCMFLCGKDLIISNSCAFTH